MPAFATLGGGCFWCLEAVFLRVRGVQAVTSGYMGGHVPNPTYEQVCGGQTGHAEIVRIEYDEAQISFADLLEIFFHTHDPTTLNRQGNDLGPQYRSAVFFHDEQQAEVARDTVKRLDAAGDFSGPIVTEISPAETFYPAEGYHQNYFELNPRQPYCTYVVSPKVAHFLEKYPDRALPRSGS